MMRGLTYDDVQRALTAALTPVNTSLTTLSADVKALNADHVTRGDMDSLRREVREALKDIQDKYQPRDVADQRYNEVNKRFVVNEADIAALQSALSSSQTESDKTRSAIDNRFITMLWAVLLLIAGAGLSAVLSYIVTHLH